MDVIENEQLSTSQAVKHWYYESKYQLIKKHLSSLGLNLSEITIADVGTGIGLFLHKLEIDGLASPERSIGIDPAQPESSQAVNSRIPLAPYFSEGRQFDVILMMDVLEHVEEDAKLLNATLQHLKDGGYLLVTVPALPFLMSAHDRYLGHYRRYTLESLRDLIASNKCLIPICTHYYFASILPIAIPWRVFNKNKSSKAGSDMKAASTTLNIFIKIICRLELVLCRHNKILGLTAVAVYKKSDTIR